MMQRRFLVSALGLCVLVVASCATAGRPKPLSDHFDGKRFFEPGFTPEERGPSDGLKFREAMEKSVWPETVPTRPDLRLAERLEPGEAAVTFVNHATVLIQLPGLNILTDPIWSERASPVSWIGPRRIREPGVSFDKLPKIDLVLVSHNHYDHLDTATLERLGAAFRPAVLLPLGDGGLARGAGLEDVKELDWWEEVEIAPGTTIIFTPARHWSRRGLYDRNESLWGSFLIRSRGRLIYFGGDTGYADHFREIRRRYGPVDLAFLPIGAYEPRWFMKDMHMNPAEAVQAHLDLESRLSVGMHYGTFHLSAEDFDRPGKDLLEALSGKETAGNEFILLEEGKTRTFKLGGA